MGYVLFPQTAMAPEAVVQTVKQNTLNLLSTSQYLLGEPDGHVSVLSTIPHARLTYVSGKESSLRPPCSQPDLPQCFLWPHSEGSPLFSEFQAAVPKKALTLVAAMVFFNAHLTLNFC